jgi:hypothetical protein
LAFSAVSFGIVVLLSFLRPVYAPMVRIAGILIAFPFIGAGIYGLVSSRSRKHAPKIRWLGGIALVLLVTGTITYGVHIRNLPHDLRATATSLLHQAFTLNRALGRYAQPTIVAKTNSPGTLSGESIPATPHGKPAARECSAARVTKSSLRPEMGQNRGFEYGTWDIVHRGFFTFTTQLHYLRIDPARFNIRLDHGKPTADLVTENGAIAGINGGYISKQLEPLGLLILYGKKSFPYVSSNIEVELVSGKRQNAPASFYRSRIEPFDDLSRIRKARQYAPDGLLIEEGRIVREINPGYMNPLLATEAIIAVLEDGSVKIVPAHYYEERLAPFEGSASLSHAFQAGPLTYFNGRPTKRNLLVAEPTRGKVAYALDDQGHLYLMTTESLRGVYGLTFSQFTDYLIEFGKTQGLNFRSIAFGDAGGAGTLTVRDEASGQYWVSGAAIKYVSSSAILVFPKQGQQASAESMPLHVPDRPSEKTPSLQPTLRPEAAKRNIEEHQEEIVERFTQGSGEQDSLLKQHITTYLHSYENANQVVGRIFVEVSRQDPFRGLLFLEELGPENLSRIFINYSSGDRISDPSFLDYDRLIPKALASNPRRAARLLVEVSRMGVKKPFPRSLLRLPPNRFHGQNSGQWIASGLIGCDPDAALELFKRAEQLRDHDILLAQMVDAFLFSSYRQGQRYVLRGIIDVKGLAWVTQKFKEVIETWLPPYEEYYQKRAGDLIRSINIFPAELRQEVADTLRRNKVMWESIEGVADVRGLSASLREDVCLIRQSYQGDPPGTTELNSGSRTALGKMVDRLRKGDLNQEIQALYVLATMRPSDGYQDIGVIAAEKLVAAADITGLRSLAHDRLCDVLLTSEDSAVRSVAIRGLLHFYHRDEGLAKREPRTLVILASQSVETGVRDEVRRFLRKSISAEELFLRIAMTSERHVLPSPLGLYRDRVASLFEERSRGKHF